MEANLCRADRRIAENAVPKDSYLLKVSFPVDGSTPEITSARDPGATGKSDKCGTGGAFIPLQRAVVNCQQIWLLGCA